MPSDEPTQVWAGTLPIETVKALHAAAQLEGISVAEVLVRATRLYAHSTCALFVENWGNSSARRE